MTLRVCFYGFLKRFNRLQGHAKMKTSYKILVSRIKLKTPSIEYRAIKKVTTHCFVQSNVFLLNFCLNFLKKFLNVSNLALTHLRSDPLPLSKYGVKVFVTTVFRP